MDGLIKEILSNLKLPGIVSGIVIPVILFFSNKNPITSLSSSPIEMILSTKEKRLYVTILRVIFKIIFYMLILLGITNTYFTSKNIYNRNIGISIFVFVIGISIWVYGQNFKNKTVFDIQNKILRIILGVFIFLSFACIFILPSYLIGTQLYSEIYNKSSNEKPLSVFVVVIVLYLIYIVLFYPLIRIYNEFLAFSSKHNINLKITIGDSDNDSDSGIGWFILHPIENELFLLGDENIISKCTQIRVIEKNELLKYKIEIINNSL